MEEVKPLFQECYAPQAELIQSKPHVGQSL